MTVTWAMMLLSCSQTREIHTMEIYASSRKSADELSRSLRRVVNRVRNDSELGHLAVRYASVVSDGAWRIDKRKFHRGRGFCGFCSHKKKLLVIACDGDARVAHELTHAIGGNEIDAETVENYLYDRTEGATPPDAQYDAWRFEVEKVPDVVPSALSTRIVGVP